MSTPMVIVEDDVVLRTAMKGALEDVGFHPIDCADLTTARAAIERAQPAVVILDLALGDEFGTELLDELAGRDEPPAVVICSAFSLANLVAARYSVPHVRKPFDFDVLIKEVERAIAQKLVPKRQAMA